MLAGLNHRYTRAEKSRGGGQGFQEKLPGGPLFRVLLHLY
jgi:hypothetical protein